jgi:hypothetical protein
MVDLSKIMDKKYREILGKCGPEEPSPVEMTKTYAVFMMEILIGAVDSGEISEADLLQEMRNYVKKHG